MTGMFSVKYGNSVSSSVSAMADISNMGRWFVSMVLSLFGFRMEMIVTRFQRCGIVLVLRAMLYMFMPSGSVDLLFVLFEMANCT